MCAKITIITCANAPEAVENEVLNVIQQGPGCRPARL